MSFSRKRESDSVKPRMIMRTYYVYIIGNARPTLYIGVTNNIIRRVLEHRSGLVGGFTNKYQLKKLLYFESTNDINVAIKREKQLKHWNREWKLELIKNMNPNFDDLYQKLILDFPQGFIPDSRSGRE